VRKWVGLRIYSIAPFFPQVDPIYALRRAFLQCLTHIPSHFPPAVTYPFLFTRGCRMYGSIGIGQAAVDGGRDLGEGG